MTSSCKQRIRKVQRFLRATGRRAALLVSSAGAAARSGDVDYPFRQNSDFYYLTGSLAKQSALLVDAAGKPTLFQFPPSAEDARWTGKPQSVRRLAGELGADLVESERIVDGVIVKLAGVEDLYFDSTPGTIAAAVVQTLLALPVSRRHRLPRSLHLAELLVEKLRLFKDSGEIRQIKQAIDLTYGALRSALPLVGPGATETEIAAALEYGFQYGGGATGFPSIVAGGPAAAVLHHEPAARKIKRGEMVLFDCGAESSLYSADISRVFPASGRFDALQTDLYQIVLEAQAAAVKQIRDGARMGALYNAAARVLTRGLVNLGVLRGKPADNLARKKFLPYFPHGIGHSLGLDVHDVGRTRGNPYFVLRSGMVITVEPGLYFAKRTGRVPACGVRIEDDVLVTKTGCRVLSAAIPKRIADVEALMSF